MEQEATAQEDIGRRIFWAPNKKTSYSFLLAQA